MERVMNISGLVIDERKIAEGIYGMVQDRGEEGIVGFGMIPVWIHDTLTKQLTEKVKAEALKKLCGSEDLSLVES